MEGERLAYECFEGDCFSWSDAQAQGEMVNLVQLTPSASHLEFRPSSSRSAHVLLMKLPSGGKDSLEDSVETVQRKVVEDDVKE